MPSVVLKDIKQETYAEILKKQTEEKIKKKCGQYSISTTINKILDEWVKNRKNEI